MPGRTVSIVSHSSAYALKQKLLQHCQHNAGDISRFQISVPGPGPPRSALLGFVLARLPGCLPVGLSQSVGPLPKM